MEVDVTTPPRVIASVAAPNVPLWAILERQLIEQLDGSLQPFVERYLRPDGSVRWPDGIDVANRNVAVVRSDAFYEGVHNWPLYYSLGGGQRALDDASRSWTGMTAQLERMGQVSDEFDNSQDWFHLGEGNLLLYGLFLAEPTSGAWRERARRFADLYLSAPNYDKSRRLITAVRTGTQGPSGLLDDVDPMFQWAAHLIPYGLPYADVPGVTSYDALRDPANARRMGKAVQDRSRHGDVVQNLAATSLVTYAYLLTGEPAYRQWVLDYVEAWLDRAKLNGGLVPDNVGLSGTIGENMSGRWYGGIYGWAWPHGYYSVVQATLIAGANALLLSGDVSYLSMARRVIDNALGHAVIEAPGRVDMSLRGNWSHRVDSRPDDPLLLVPYRYGADGWFDYMPPGATHATHLWLLSMDARDRERLDDLRARCGYAWEEVLPLRNKTEDGHEEPWLRFLDGANPGYPVVALQQAIARVRHRLDLIRADTTVMESGAADKHHLTGFNPVVTETLLQLTCGAPQVLYNAGLPTMSVAYRDAEAGRPGLPPGVAALVTAIRPNEIEVEMVNLEPVAERRVIVTSGRFGEHLITSVRYTAANGAQYPGETGYGGAYGLPDPQVVHRSETMPMPTGQLEVELPPGTEVTLQLGIRRNAGRPVMS